RPVFEHLRADEVLLGTTSARLRRVHAGATLELAGGRRVTVAGIVDDSVIGAAEVAFTRTGASTELPAPRYLLVAYDGDRTLIEGGDRSRHAWGAAVDLNYAKNPTQIVSAQDPRLVDVMTRWGFTWGGHWLVPDPAHFEFLRLPPSG